jgi:glutaredoxin
VIVARRRSLFGLAALVLVGLAAVQGIGAWSRERLGVQVAAVARPGDIQMIGSETCVYCTKARAWFEQNKVPFNECLIERDPACAAAYEAMRAPGTPVMLVRGQRLLGFSAQAIADALTPRSQ